MKEETKRIVALYMNKITCQLHLVHSADQMLFDSNVFVAKPVKLQQLTAFRDYCVQHSTNLQDWITSLVEKTAPLLC